MGKTRVTSMGPFFLLAGAGGFAWRVYYVRWNMFRDKWYLLAGCIFAIFVIPWALRNVLRFGRPHWETQPHANGFVFVRRYPLTYSVGPGTAVGLVIYGRVFGDQAPPAPVVTVHLYRAANLTLGGSAPS